MSGSQVGAVLGVVVLAIVASIGVLIVGAVAMGAMNAGTVQGAEEIRDFDVGESQLIHDSVDEAPSELSVRATREHALLFDGDGYVEGDGEGWPEGDWSVCAVAQLDGNEQATYNLVSHDNASILLDYADGDWRAIHYVGEESAEAAVSASNASSLSPVCATWDDTADELTVYEAGQNDTGTLTAEAPDRSVSNEWVGAVDEVRLVNETLAESDVQAYQDDPITPLANADHSVRYMFNEGEGSATYGYYAGSSATIVNGAWGAGVEDPGLTEGVDYGLSFSPFEVTALEGGYLDGAPTFFVDYGSAMGGVMASILQGTGDALGLVPVVLILLMLGILLGTVNRMRG